MSHHCTPRAVASLPLFEPAALECGVAERRSVAGVPNSQQHKAVI